MNEQLAIDIAGVVEQKIGRKLPFGGAYLLRKLIHEQEINDILCRLGHFKGADFLRELLKDLNVQVSWRNPEALPRDGRVLFVCNHPLGAIDGVGLSHLLAEHYGSIQYLVNDMLYYLKPLQPVFLPVNTYGAQKRAAVERINQVLASDVPVGTFPAGYCSRVYDGIVQDREWKSSFINMAIAHKRDVVPLHFVGRNSSKFYRIDRIRRALGVKFDVCTTLLPDEMFQTRGKSFEVVVGEPISWQYLATSSERPQQLAEKIRMISYGLAGGAHKTNSSR